MKSKGFTLVEIISVLAIIGILATVGSIGSKFFIKLKTDMELESCTYEMRQLLTMAKKYCRTNEISGKINIVQYDSEIIFNASKNIKTIILPENIKITSNYNIEINEEGYINNAITIIIIGYKGKHKEISIGVGNDIISIK